MRLWWVNRVVWHAGKRGFAPAPMAQLAEATDLKSVCCRFESDWGYHDYRSRSREKPSAKRTLPLAKTLWKPFPMLVWILLALTIAPHPHLRPHLAAAQPQEQCALFPQEARASASPNEAVAPLPRCAKRKERRRPRQTIGAPHVNHDVLSP